jgi:hypothetical protein
MKNAISRLRARLASGSCAALVAVASSGFVAVAAPATAQAAPTLTCTITPGGTSSTGSCSTNALNYAYNGNYVVSGLPAGNYTYAWSTNGAKPQPISCSGAICNQALDAAQQDVMQKVNVVATNTSTGATYPLTVRVTILAVCGGPGSMYWC